jgi:long-chain acyl-CoA synthetase
MVRSVETLAHVLPAAAARHGRRRALVSGDHAFTFRELDRLSARVAAALHGLGVAAGDRVTIYAANGWEWIVSYYAVARIGAVVNPVNVLLTPEELCYIAADCGARAIVTAPHRTEAVLDIRGDTALETVITLGDDTHADTRRFAELLRAAPDAIDRRVQPDDLAAIMYTSGTTGHPKGAMLSHRNLWLNAALTATMHVRTPSDTTVTAVPLCHVYGADILNASMISGATLVLLSRFGEVPVLTAIEQHAATLFEGVPTMLLHLLNCAELDRFDLSTLTRCTTGGQTMAVDKMEEVERRFGCPLLEVWGMTEIAGIGTTHPFHAPNRLGSIGLPVPGCECRLADGELLFRGPLIMQGYYGNADATRATIDPDGWLRTGDVATIDDDGYIRIIDRMKDVILSGGYNVYPAEIERVLAMHPAVAMAAVAAERDYLRGEVPKAYVVLRSGGAADARELQSFCREHLAAYKTPRTIRIVPDLPKTSTGKILRRALQTLDAIAVSSG